MEKTEEFISLTKQKPIIFVTPELKSFKARAGGLGPAVEELAIELAKLGCDVRVISLLYRSIVKDGYKIRIDPEELGVKEVEKSLSIKIGNDWKKLKVFECERKKVHFYFLQNSEIDAIYLGDLFRHAIILGRGSLELIIRFNLKPSIIHLHDGMAGITAFFRIADPKYWNFEGIKNSKMVFTVHNAGIAYQQIFPQDRFWELNVSTDFRDKIVWNGNLNLTYAALINSDKCNTVSKDYEITLKTYGEGLREVFRKVNIIGITNGIDIDYWRFDEFKKVKNAEELEVVKKKKKEELINETKRITGKKLSLEKIICVMPRRLADQKGFNTILPLIPIACKERSEGGLSFQFIVLGLAHPNDPIGHKWAEEFKRLHNEIEEFVFIYDFSEKLAKLMYAGGDVILYPSLPNKEPCGTGYMMAAVNGTPCIGTRTGGMAEKIEDFDFLSGKGNGFLVWKEEYSTEAFWRKLKEVSDLYYLKKEVWKKVCWNAFHMDVSMEKTAKEYIHKLYIPAIKE